MPKKTRKQKILSDMHKKSSLNSFAYTYSAGSIKPKNTEKKSIDSLETYTLIRKDINKTILLAIVFIAFEIGIAIYSKKLGW